MKLAAIILLSAISLNAQIQPKHSACGINTANYTNGVVNLQIHVDAGDTIVLGMSLLQRHTLNGNCQTNNCAGVNDISVTDTFGNQFKVRIDDWITANQILGDQDTSILSTNPSEAVGSGVDTITVAETGSGPIQCSVATGCYNGGTTSTNGADHFVACATTYSGVGSFVLTEGFKNIQATCVNGICGPLTTPLAGKPKALNLTASQYAIVLYGSDNKPSFNPNTSWNGMYTSPFLTSCMQDETCSNTQQELYPNCTLNTTPNADQLLIGSGSASAVRNGQSPAELCWDDLTPIVPGFVKSSMNWYAQDNSDTAILVMDSNP